MFERSKVDNSQQQVGVAVEIAHNDGGVEKGKLLIAVSSKVADILNGPSQFLEFETYEGARSMIAKSSLKSVRMVAAPGAGTLHARARDGEFDPYHILGLAPGATRDEVRHAYHAHAKTYHPDRYASAELPKEVCDYLAAMTRRVNAAYAALEQPLQVKRQAAHNRTEPVYSSQPR